MTALSKLYGSLSTRLLTLTALWVTFMVASIAYTMLLSWRMEQTASAVNIVANMRAQVYRANVMVDERFDRSEFNTLINSISEAIAALQRGDGLQPLTEPSREKVSEQISYIERQWSYVIFPELQRARERGYPIDNAGMEPFTGRLSNLEAQLNIVRTDLLDQLRHIQLLLIVLAIGSLFVIMWLLLRWVIRPTESLGTGIAGVTEGKLETRVELSGSLEFERIGLGFNRMADRLQDLLENLEAKVAEKTATVEEKNRDLAQLYEMTSYFGQQHTVDELCEGFTARIMQYTKASGCSVFLLNKKRTELELVAGLELPAQMFSRLSLQPVVAGEVQKALDADLPLRLTTDVPSEFLAALRVGESYGFDTSYLFHIRNGSKDIGLYLLYFTSRTQLPLQAYRLYENFGTHLGIAIDNQRLIEKDQQYAVVQERNLMAQGLHDSIAQSLSFLNLQVQLLESGLKNQDHQLVEDTVGQIRTGVQESYEDVRELLLNFRERLHKESFTEAIATVIDRFESQTKVKVNLRSSGEGAELSDRQKLQVIFIMQEALANIRKHSQATQAVIAIQNNGDFTVEVSDNGCGINQDLLKARSGRHVGMNIMKERSERIGAKVEIGAVDASLFASGTTVRLTIPEALRRVSH